jgi:hypothetical protein
MFGRVYLRRAAGIIRVPVIAEDLPDDARSARSTLQVLPSPVRAAVGMAR